MSLADAWARFSFSVPGSRPNVETYPHEEAAARKAVALDDENPRAHALLADIAFAEAFDWPTAEAEYRRALELAPKVASLHARLAVFLGAMGRFEDGAAEAWKAAALDPSSAAANIAMCQILYWQHRDAEALEQGLETIRKDPQGLTGHYLTGFVYERLGRFEDAIRETKAATVRGDAGSLSMLGYAYAVSGNRAEAERILARLSRHPGAKNVPYRRAAIHLALGQKERALELLETDYAQRSNWMNRLKVDPIFDPLRGDPRFKALLAKLKFPG
jgi:serine/threonine-protein kinase